MSITDQTLDARGLSCPLPILKTRQALNTMTGGQTLKIIATDLGFVKDISGFCQQTGNVLVSSSEQRHEHVFVIRKS